MADGAQLRRTWDEACDRADAAVRSARDAARRDGDTWVERWLTTELGQLATLQAMVDGRRLRPGDAASGLLHDVPPDLQRPAYAPAVTALERVAELYGGGLGHDFRRGWPQGWPTSLGDRLRARVTVRRS